MSSLQEIKQQLILNADRNEAGQDNMARGLAGIALGINSMLGIMKQNQLDMLEAMREKKSAPALAPATTKSSGSDSGFLMPGLLGLGGLTSAVAAIGASLTGLDDAFRAIGLLKLAKNINMGAGRLATQVEGFVKGIANIGQKFGDFGKNLSRIVFIPEEGVKSLAQQIYKIFGLGVDGKPVVGTSEFMKALYDPKKALMNAIKPISTFFDDLVRPVTNFFEGIKGGGPIGSMIGFFDNLSGLGKFIPRINFDALRAAIGSIEDGTGLLGFFGSVQKFLAPLLKPFATVLKVITRPFTQILLSAIDFIVGFFKGFFNTDGDFGTKMLAGLEGGIKGIILGITDAIDLLFIKFPAFIAEKLGFKNAADKLREFSLSALVDPAWEAVKNFFKNLFKDPTGTLGSGITSAASAVNDFIKSILRMVLPDPGKPFDFLDPSSYVSRVIPDSVYEYAGLNPKTGELINRVEPKVAADPDEMAGMSEVDRMRMGRGGPTNIIDNSSRSSSSSTTPLHLGGGPNSYDANDPYLTEFGPAA